MNNGEKKETRKVETGAKERRKKQEKPKQEQRREERNKKSRNGSKGEKKETRKAETGAKKERKKREKQRQLEDEKNEKVSLQMEKVVVEYKNKGMDAKLGQCRKAVCIRKKAARTGFRRLLYNLVRKDE